MPLFDPNFFFVLDPYTFNMSLSFAWSPIIFICYWILTLSLFPYHLHYHKWSSFVTGSLHFSYCLIICITYHYLHLLLDPYTFIIFFVFTWLTIISICYWILTLWLWSHHLDDFKRSSFVTGSLHSHCFFSLWFA